MTGKRLIRVLALCGCAAGAIAAPAHADNDDNPPGPRGGPGTNWENRPGVAGGPGASPELRFWSREAWDRFCVENPKRCGSRRDVGFGPDPRALDLDGGATAAGQGSKDEPGEASVAADTDMLPAAQVGQD